MLRPSPILLASVALASSAFVATGSAIAHHSIAMFDRGHPIVLTGTVREYRFASPHTIILLEVKGADTRAVIWSLEETAPTA